MNLHPSPMPLSRLLAEARLPTPVGGDPTVSGISSDSRALMAGEVFVALRGLNTDARRHIPEAVAKGASAIVCEATEGEALPPCPLPLVIVQDARAALSRLYDAWYDHPSRRLRLVGVTGTNGKTTVSCMLRAMLRAEGRPCGMIGTLGCYLPTADQPLEDENGRLCSGMTTPDPGDLYLLLARMAAEGESGAEPIPVVMEVTSHALLLGKVAPLLFELSVFTNLSAEHMDMHGSMDAYFAAKRRLFEVTRLAVINADDRWGRHLLAEPLPVRHYCICHAEGLQNLTPDRMCPAGEGGCTRYYAEQVKYHGEEGISFKLTSPDVRLRLRCPIPGRFTVMNAMQAAVAALSLDVSPAVVRDTLATFCGVAGRMERILLPETDIPFTVFVDFAQTPDALENLLATVHGFRRHGRRIVLVFGCGGDRDRSKRKVMARIASRMADSLVITSDNSRSEDPDDIIADILAGVDKESEFAVVQNRGEAIRYAIRHARPDDIILLAGKGHETYEIDRTGKHPFCEKDIVVEAAQRFHGKSNREN